MTGSLEHANITASDLDAAIDFLCTAIPEFRVRGAGMGPDRLRWVHVGSDSSYIAVNEANPKTESAARWRGVNHLGFVVDDAEAVKRRLEEKGYRDGVLVESHPYRKRFYVFDRDGNEWEFVEYLSDALEERNDYSLG